jgi:hypothetical protein
MALWLPKDKPDASVLARRERLEAEYEVWHHAEFAPLPGIGGCRQRPATIRSKGCSENPQLQNALIDELDFDLLTLLIV